MAASPTPPQPMTAMESPRPTLPVLIAAPMPAITPQPSNPATSGFTAGFDLGALPGVDQGLLDERADAQCGESSARRSRVIFCAALWVAKQYQGSPRRQARQFPQTARQLRMTKSPGATSVTPSPTDSTIPAASCPSRNGKSSLIPPSR